jgi:hypothetical protein
VRNADEEVVFRFANVAAIDCAGLLDFKNALVLVPQKTADLFRLT